jgi:hypothetical protein
LEARGGRVSESFPRKSACHHPSLPPDPRTPRSGIRQSRLPRIAISSREQNRQDPQ